MKKRLFYTLAILLIYEGINIQSSFADIEENRGQQEKDIDPENQSELNPWDPRGN
jgi:hypothetical protein